jgi:protease PrsW
MGNFALFAFAVAPSLLICWYIFKMDKYEREPRLHLFVCFLLGILCTLPAINMETIGRRIINEDPHNLIRTFLFATLVVGLTEEILKFFALMLYAFPRKQFNEPMDGVVYSVMTSMGFAAMENILYVQGNPNEAWEIAMARAFTAVPAHGLFAVAMGSYVGSAKFMTQPADKLKYCLKGLLIAILLHGVYDFLLIQELFQLLMTIATLSVVGGWYYSDKVIIKEHQDASPFRTDHHNHLTTNELAQMDRHKFIQSQEIIEMMLAQMRPLGQRYDNWGEVYLAEDTGDKWLKFMVASGFTEDTSPRLVRLPGPSVNEIIHLVFTSDYDDEIESSASFLTAFETFEQRVFRQKLIKRLEEFDIKELNDLHRERFKLLIEATNLTQHEPIIKNGEDISIVERATRLLYQLV